MKATSTIILALAAAVEAGVQRPVEPAKIGGATSQGCFKGQGDWKFYSPGDIAMSQGTCTDIIAAEGLKPLVFALTSEGCWFGDNYPPKADLVGDDNCDYPCPAFNQEACGGFDGNGNTFYSVFNNGIKIAVTYKEESSGSETSSAVTGNNPAATSPGSAQSPSSSDTSSNGDSTGPSVGGIVGGVVAGVAVVGILAGIGFWVWRRKRNHAIEEEHRRNAAVNSFISGAKPPSSSGGLSMTDSRMDPIMAHHRRQSDGSIADNQDYSRKILRVTNA